MYYKSVDTPPHIIWIFDKNILPNEVEIIQTDSASGDKCHYDIKNLNAGFAKRIFTENFDLLKNGKICNNKNPRKFTKKDLELIEN